MFAPQYPARPAAGHLRPHARRREQRPGHQGDQPPQSLHRHAGPRRPRTSRSSSGCRSCSAASRCCSSAPRVLGTVKEMVDAIVVFGYFGAFSLWSFGYRCIATATTWRRRRRSKSIRSCRRCSAISRSPTSRCIRIPRPARTCWSGALLLLRGVCWRGAGAACMRARLITELVFAAGHRRRAALSVASGQRGTTSPQRGGRRARRRRKFRATNLEGRASAPADTVAAAGTHRRGAGRAPSSRSRQASMSATSSSIGLSTSSGTAVRASSGRARAASSGSRRVTSPSRASTSTAAVAAARSATRRASTSRPRVATIRDCPDRAGRSSASISCEADDARVERSRGRRHRAAGTRGEQGPASTCSTRTRFRLVENEMQYARDGFYIQSSSHGRVRGKRGADVCATACTTCYSDDNVFEDNLLRDGAAGAAVMYSRRHRVPPQPVPREPRIRVGRAAPQGLRRPRRRRQSDRRQRARRVPRGLDRQRVSPERQWPCPIRPLVLFDSSRDMRLRRQRCSAATCRRCSLVGRRTDTVFDGNFWSDADEPDLDGDGVRDRPFRLSNVFDHLRGNLTAADLLRRGPARARSERGRTDVPGARAVADRPGSPSARAAAGSFRRASRRRPDEPVRRAGSRCPPPRSVRRTEPSSSGTRRHGQASPMIAFRNFSKRFGAHRRRVRPRRSTSRAARSSRCSAPMGRARRRSIKAAAGLIRPIERRGAASAIRRPALDAAARRACAFLPQKCRFPISSRAAKSSSSIARCAVTAPRASTMR